MAFIEGINPCQLQLTDCINFDEYISEDSYVRVIKAFVDSLDLDSLGFVTFSGSNPRSKTLSH